MSANKEFLLAVSKSARVHVKYVDLAEMRDTDSVALTTSTRRVYICVGRHQMVLLHPNLKRFAKAGTVEYKWIDMVYEDTCTATCFTLSLNRERSSDFAKELFFSSDNRSSLLSQVSICFLADAMFRLGKIIAFPKAPRDLGTKAEQGKVAAFKRYRKCVYGDYCFFMREEFEEDLAGATPGTQTGRFRAPVTTVLSAPSSSRTPTEDWEVEVAFHVYEPVPVDHLGQIGREHVRWLATEYKQAMIRNQQTFVLRNKTYLKKMNLSNDMAAWIGWELFLQDKNWLKVAVFLRRQYMPPLLDTAQDIVLVLTCPYGAVSSRPAKLVQDDLLHEAHLMADTLGLEAHSVTIYAEIIQAKLDALHYHEDAWGWIRSRLKMKPDGDTGLEKWATIYVKGVLKILLDENAIAHPELWDEASSRVAQLSTLKSEQDMDPMVVSQHQLKHPMEGLSLTSEPDDHTIICLNAWHARVAAYLAHCLDGGLFGSKITLSDIVNQVTQDKVSQTATHKIAEILAFLLHLRPKDLRKRWEPKLLVHQMVSMGLVSLGLMETKLDADDLERAQGCTFNDRVMQVMLELNYIEKLLPPNQEEGSMSAQFANLLQYLLLSHASSVNLKATICRQIVAAKDAEYGPVLCVGLLHVLRTGGLFLATYACAAVVNLSQAKEVVKNFLIASGVEVICLSQLQSKDDDLTLYTLMLLVHLTKSANHRKVLIQRGLVPHLYDILLGSYSLVQYKRRVLTELCSVLGQVCVDEETRQMICENHQAVIDCLLQIFDTAEALVADGQPGGARKPGELLAPASTKIISKVLFALKQLCTNSTENKDLVGQRVIKAVVRDLQEPRNLEYKDWATNAILLLLLLAVSRPNRDKIEQCDWAKTYSVLFSSPLGKLDATRDRIQQIDDRIEGDPGDEAPQGND